MPASASDSVDTGFFFAAMIPLNDGYRGSLIFSPTDTTAGSSADSIVIPSSVSRFTVTDEPSTVISLACVSAGSPRTSATIAGTAALRPSDASLPASTRSTPSSVPITVASARAVWTAHDPCKRLVGQVHRLVGAHRQRLADRVGSPVRTHRHDGHLGAVVGLLDLQAPPRSPAR